MARPAEAFRHVQILLTVFVVLAVDKLGGRIAFRVMAESVSSRHRYVTPEWVFDEGAPSVLHRNRHGDEQIDPVFWTEAYLDHCCRFIDGK
ncbi:MAG: hypothetical protein HQ582_28740 [Planctomycetes bacterium]|nr:hypothetical protein [Planctomycetota bacterium]